MKMKILIYYLFVASCMLIVEADQVDNDYNDNIREKEAHILSNGAGFKMDGSHHSGFATSNGIKREDYVSPDGLMEGTSSYFSPEGVEIKTTYVADENGYHPVGDHIPKIPDYIIRALDYIRLHPYVEKDYYTGEFKTPKAPTIPTRSAAAYHHLQQRI